MNKILSNSWFIILITAISSILNSLFFIISASTLLFVVGYSYIIQNKVYCVKAAADKTFFQRMKQYVIIPNQFNSIYFKICVLLLICFCLMILSYYSEITFAIILKSLFIFIAFLLIIKK